MDIAFLRRFDKRIDITPPDLVTKEQLRIDSLTCIEHEFELTESDFKEIITKLGSFSCSDICSLCCEAMLVTLRELQATEDWE